MQRRKFLIRSMSAGAAFVGFPVGYHSSLVGAEPKQTHISRTATGPLRVHPDNRRYFANSSGRAVYLTGSHVWNNLVDIGPGDPPPRFDFVAYLDFLEKYGHNFIRLWTWEHTAWDTSATGRWGKKTPHTVAPHPWARGGPGMALDGKPKFDLNEFNDDYFNRLRPRFCRLGAMHPRRMCPTFGSPEVAITTSINFNKKR